VGPASSAASRIAKRRWLVVPRSSGAELSIRTNYRAHKKAPAGRRSNHPPAHSQMEQHIMSQDHPAPHLDERDEQLVRIFAREIVHQLRMHELECHSLSPAEQRRQQEGVK
jgi:hypothetical protein